MTDNLNKPTKGKKPYQEENFYLLDLLKNNACLRCINKSCRITDEHGINFPDKMSTFVQNPTYISEIGKVIDSAKLDFSGKKPFYTICNYVHKKCRNCEDGRIKYINYDDKQIILCYPFLDNIKNKVTVGVHIDIKLVMKGHKYEVSCIPLEVKFEKKIFPKNYEKLEKNDDNQFNGREEVLTPYSDKTFVEVWDEDIFASNCNKSKFSLEKFQEIEWPLLSPKEIKKNDSIKDYSKLKKIINNETPNDKSNDKSNDKLNDKFNDRSNDRSNDKSNKKNFDIRNNFDTPTSINFENNRKNFDKNEINDENIININYSKIVDKNKKLEDDLIILKLENKKLKEDIENFRNLMKNNKVYDEILYNVNSINNRVTEDFLSTNYSEYLIF